VPVVSTLGVFVCGAMIYGLGWTNWLRLIVWLLIGLVIYFGYGRSHSKVQALSATALPPKGAPSMAD
jgi:APA family basic amino acid/polyamine antiporter